MTGDTILVPTVIVVGSFLIPVTWRRSRCRAGATAT